VKTKGVLLLYIPSNIETKRKPFGGMLAMPWLFFSFLFSSLLLTVKEIERLKRDYD
jgi:hypothetical protein